MNVGNRFHRVSKFWFILKIYETTILEELLKRNETADIRPLGYFVYKKIISYKKFNDFRTNAQETRAKVHKRSKEHLINYLIDVVLGVNIFS